MAGVGETVAAALAGITGRVFVGYSGGLDSTVLLHAVTASRSRGVIAVHVHHGLHAEAGRWQAHCARTCAAWGVPLHAVAVTVPRQGNLEARARGARYQAFLGVLEHADDHLLLAHHLDDQAETGLLRLLQGRGLYGMPSARPLGPGRLLRPLLGLPRADLAAYAATHDLDWIEDPSNADLRHDRNYVRHRLLPQLRARWPDVARSIVGALPPPDAALQGAAETLATAELRAMTPQQAVAVLRAWLGAHGHAAPRRAALAAFIAQLDAADDRQPRLALQGAELRRFRGRLYRVKVRPPLQPVYAIDAPGRLELPHGELRVVPDPDGWRPHGALEVRFRRGGEQLRWRGHQRAVKQLLQDAGLPPWQRDLLPLVYDAAGLLAVPGIAHRAGTGDPARMGFRAQWRGRGEFL